MRLIDSTLTGKHTNTCPLVAKKPNLATDFAGLEISIEDPVKVAAAASIYISLQNPKTQQKIQYKMYMAIEEVCYLSFDSNSCGTVLKKN